MTIDNVFPAGSSCVIDELINNQDLLNNPVHISFDIDAVNPIECPSTGMCQLSYHGNNGNRAVVTMATMVTMVTMATVETMVTMATVETMVTMATVVTAW